MRHTGFTTLISVAWLAWAPAAAGQGTIALRGAARVEPGAPVRLGDVASLTGAEAEALAGLVLIPSDARRGRDTIDTELVRRAIDERAGGTNWGRLTLGGASCVILPPQGAAPSAARPASTEPAVTVTGTVRAVVADRLGRMLDASPTDLRLVFDDSDREVLGLPVGGRIVDVRPTGLSERMPVQVTVYEVGGESIAAARTIRVGVQVRRPVVLAAVARRRGDLVGPGDVTGEFRWVGPATAAMTPDRVVGSAVRSRLTPGAVVTPQDIEPPIVVDKGDLVAVHCVSGTIVVRLTARALGSARDGEVVRLQSLVDGERTFYGRMNGRGRAVAVAPDTTEAPR